MQTANCGAKARSTLSTRSGSKDYGSYTQQVVASIQAGNDQLHSISVHTGIHYGTVNSIITSLEKQQRVEAADPFVKRQNQKFKVVHATRRATPVQSRVFHPNVSVQSINQLLGMGSLPISGSSIQGRVVCVNY